MDFEEFYDSHFDKYLLHAEFFLSHDDAEDVLQDVLFFIWRKWGKITFVKNIDSYTIMILRNRCIDLLRHKKYEHDCYSRMSTLLYGDFLYEQFFNVTPSRVLESSESVNSILLAVEHLPKKCRQIFQMSRDEGLKYQEIAEILNLSVNTVECQMVIALRKLRKELKIS
jgi:RNA polymerase sigma-70 factor (ECF subfamily)